MNDVSAKELWREKLDSLQAAEALAVDPAEKFKIGHDIAEARRKLQELHAEASATFTPGHPPPVPVNFSSIDKYAPAQLIGRDVETDLLNIAWTKARNNETRRPHILTFVALDGEGKTSLVAKWAADLAHRGWPGCDAVFAWSFYSQGAREEAAASSDLFLKEALTFFGDEVTAGSAQGAFEKGQRLARLAGERRTLLILDGLEPLQYAPTSPTPGELKDAGLATLLKGLAANNRGLCVVTTRYSITDLRAHRQTTAPELNLLRLSMEAGVALLVSLGVTTGAVEDFETLVEDVQGHALTLNLLGTYLRDAYGGDIRRRDRVKLEEADEEQGGHAFRVMDAYVRWFESEGKHGKRALALLRLLGMFDRPAKLGCLKALWNAPLIPDLTEPLAGTSEARRNLAIARLEKAKLIIVNRVAGTLVSLDAHPLLREYFAKAFRERHPESWRAAHSCLYKHLYATTEDKPKPELADLQPLYQAVVHGCRAGMHQEAYDKVYHLRIRRGREFFSTANLGAWASELGAAACFFEEPWRRVSSALMEDAQSSLLFIASFCLRALGRLTEALEPLRAALEMEVKRQNWRNAAAAAANLSLLELTLGEVVLAVADSEQAVIYAERSGDAFQQIVDRATHADALHQAGRRDDAAAHFREAEETLAGSQPAHPLLYTLAGFRYCDLLLASGERAAWRCTINSSCFSEPSSLADSCRAVIERAAMSLHFAEQNNLSLLRVTVDRLTLSRAALYAAVMEDLVLDQLDNYRESLQHAVDGLRRTGQKGFLPLGLLTRAWLRFLTGAHTGPDSAQYDLDEAFEIAERGPMPLFLADIHLHRARLFGLSKDRPESYPWASREADLAEARRLIEKHGYGRRKEELEDAEAAARQQSGCRQ